MGKSTTGLRDAKTSTNRCLSWTTSLMTLRTFASKQLAVVVAQTVADRPQRTLSVQKLNYSERKKKMGVADQNPEQIPDHRPRPRHQHQLQHQHQNLHQNQRLSQPKKNQRRNRMTIGVK